MYTYLSYVTLYNCDGDGGDALATCVVTRVCSW